MTTCKKCNESSENIAEVLSLCAECIRRADDECLAEVVEVHAESRKKFGLPASPPRASEGARCGLCQNSCQISIGDRGYCGVRRNEKGRLMGGTPKEAVVSWYYDPLPTNCVADWVCAGGTGAGYPKWAYQPGPEHGYQNLAVFYESCTFNCLFCQNWHYRKHSTSGETRSARELAEAVSGRTSCICFFGGDPTCQLPHALSASRLARKQNQQRILRICWETNGSMNPKLLDKMMDMSLESGGCVKFDLKAMDTNIHYALCGVSNKQTFQNFARAAQRIAERSEPPPLIASTLLVPGYIDAREIGKIASFIAGINPDIPYALLGFHGDFLMTDLPRTSWEQANRCLKAAKDAGLKNVRIGNTHILT
jgi:pyruvate formate lyase activating enzyme